MFAHHVIASLQQYYDPVKCDDPLRRKLWEDWQLYIPVIQQAQQFHVEDGDVLKGLCHSYGGQPLWEHTEQHRLPFKTTWLDYVVRQKAIPTSQLKFRSPTFGSRFRPPDGVFNEREAILAIEITPTTRLSEATKAAMVQRLRKNAQGARGHGGVGKENEKAIPTHPPKTRKKAAKK